MPPAVHPGSMGLLRARSDHQGSSNRQSLAEAATWLDRELPVGSPVPITKPLQYLQQSPFPIRHSLHLSTTSRHGST